jgi:hypothetical protein
MIILVRGGSYNAFVYLFMPARTVPDHSIHLRNTAILVRNTEQTQSRDDRTMQIDNAKRWLPAGPTVFQSYLLLTHQVGGCVDSLFFRLSQRWCVG